MVEDTKDEGSFSGSTPPLAASASEPASTAGTPEINPLVGGVSSTGTAAEATEQAPAKKVLRRSRKTVTPAEVDAAPPAPPAPPVEPVAAEPEPAAPVAEEVAAAPAPEPAPPPVSKPLSKAPGKVAASKPLPATRKAPAKAEPAPLAAAPTAKAVAAPTKSVPAKPAAVAAPVADSPKPDTPHAKVSEPLKIRVTHAAVAAAAAASRKEHSLMTTATDFSEKFQSAFKDASEKAKAAFEKSQTAFGDAGEFAKGNVEAVVESSKILASGLQEMGKGYVAEGKTAMESLTAEIKELAAAKSPTEFFEKQTALVRKQFDAAVAASSKHSEAVLKLASDAFQPISNRVSLAVEKIKQAA